MLIGACGTLLSRELDAVAMAPPEGTPLAALAGTTKGMARAYADDGATFFAGGDLVNALAAYYYGFGWLHFGLAYGLLSLPGKKPACPFGGSKRSTLPGTCCAARREDPEVCETARYRMHLGGYCPGT